MPNLLIRNSKFGLNNPLVRISAVCCVVGTNGMQTTPASNFSLMKCLSISTCLVQSCCTGLCSMLIAALLSQYNFIGDSIGFFNSSSILCSHRISQTPFPIARYSASALLRATTFCFLLLQVTRFPINTCNIRKSTFYLSLSLPNLHL